MSRPTANPRPSTLRHTRIPCPHCGTPMYKTAKQCYKCYDRLRREEADANLAERFYSYVEHTDGCWLWRGPTAHDGYGVITYHNRATRAHRVAYIIAHGTIPDGTIICHTCDNPLCVRPDHLYAGSLADNRRDAQQRNRWARKNLDNVPRGERNTRARLTDDDVREIRTALARGETQPTIAKRYGVKQAAISDIKLGKTWKHVL